MYGDRYIEGMCRNAVLRHDCERTRRTGRMLKLVFFTAVLWTSVLASILSFAVWMQDLAYAERGYYAVGGEMLVILAFVAVVLYVADRISAWVVSRLK